ncbi:MAG: prepilin-type N-terminal cleavage/methylation domain-containing protein [Phycisphaerae bacterium]|nr:prepilin-type N-terminal cleavage/methylation domain-containing protein [Phycisphaerae bacterium]
MRRSAFTLVELLIVVIILGILAAVVIPQFSDASDDARLSSLTTNLQTIRGQIELYKLQHNGLYPTAADVVAQLTGTTDVAGATTGTDFGPYLQTMPNNPFTNTNTVGSGVVGSSAWYYNVTGGVFKANDNAAHNAL